MKKRYLTEIKKHDPCAGSGYCAIGCKRHAGFALKMCIRDGLKVDSFLNHQIDTGFLCEVGKEFHRLYGNCGVNKILTIEASGIGVACLTAQFFNCPVVFAKKSKSSNISPDVYSAKVESYTHKRTYDILVSKEFLKPDDRILIIDDFLARGNAPVSYTHLNAVGRAEYLILDV